MTYSLGAPQPVIQYCAKEMQMNIIEMQQILPISPKKWELSLHTKYQEKFTDLSTCTVQVLVKFYEGRRISETNVCCELWQNAAGIWAKWQQNFGNISIQFNSKFICHNYSLLGSATTYELFMTTMDKVRQNSFALLLNSTVVPLLMYMKPLYRYHTLLV